MGIRPGPQGGKLRQGHWEALAKVRLLAAVGPHPKSPQWVCSLQRDLFLRFHSVTLALNSILTHKTPELEENKRCVGLSGPADPQWTTQPPHFQQEALPSSRPTGCLLALGLLLQYLLRLSSWALLHPRGRGDSGEK